MRFYDRISELNALERVHKLVSDTARLSVITGRRRIGKTRLIRTFCEDKKVYISLYLGKVKNYCAMNLRLIFRKRLGLSHMVASID